MELKHLFGIFDCQVIELLIVPYGIETINVTIEDVEFYIVF